MPLLEFAIGGFGDHIAESRFVPPAAAAIPGLTLVVRPSLKRLFGLLGMPVATVNEVDPRDRARALRLWRGDDYGTQDVIGYSASLRDGERIVLELFRGVRPAPLWWDPYIRVPEADGFRIGLCWHGSTGPRRDPRAVPVEALRPLLAMSGVQFIALHDTPASVAELRELPEGKDVLGLADLGVCDWADTAGVVQQCDAVVSSDTAVFHLAATLGRPTYLLAADNKQVPWLEPDARHRRVPRGGPWYSSVELIRNWTPPNDWAEVISEVCSELEGTSEALGSHL